MFEVGQRVLCVDDRWVLWVNGVPADPQPSDWCTPKRGSIYEVAGLGLMRMEGEVREMIVIAQFGNQGWDCRYFVPLKKTETDISVFTAMLTK